MVVSGTGASAAANGGPNLLTAVTTLRGKEEERERKREREREKREREKRERGGGGGGRERERKRCKKERGKKYWLDYI